MTSITDDTLPAMLTKTSGLIEDYFSELKCYCSHASPAPPTSPPPTGADRMIQKCYGAPLLSTRTLRSHSAQLGGVVLAELIL